jgi:hypothetical protein
MLGALLVLLVAVSALAAPPCQQWQTGVFGVGIGAIGWEPIGVAVVDGEIKVVSRRCVEGLNLVPPVKPAGPREELLREGVLEIRSSPRARRVAAEILANWFGKRVRILLKNNKNQRGTIVNIDADGVTLRSSKGKEARVPWSRMSHVILKPIKRPSQKAEPPV